MKDNGVLKVLLDFLQTRRVSCRFCGCEESAPVHSSSFPLNAVRTTHFTLLALSYESKDHMCNMQTEINPVGKRK